MSLRRCASADTCFRGRTADVPALLGCRASRANKLQTPDATETFEDYKDFDGVLMPVKATSREGDDLAITLITSVTYDDVNDSVFALPEAVKKVAATKPNP